MQGSTAVGDQSMRTSGDARCSLRIPSPATSTSRRTSARFPCS
jgi:hypothetical protein